MDPEVLPVNDVDGACGSSSHDASAGEVTGGNELAKDGQYAGCAKIPSVSAPIVWWVGRDRATR